MAKYLTMTKLFTSYRSTRRRTSCRVVPVPRRVMATSKGPFVLGDDIGVLCPRNGRGVRHGTGFLTSCLGATAKGSFIVRTKARKRGTVMLTLKARSRGPRSCRLGIANSKVAVATPARTKMFCKVRSLHGSLPITVNTRVTLPTMRVGSTPHFTCHNTRFSADHRFFAMSRIGACVSVVTLRGVGHFR